MYVIDRRDEANRKRRRQKRKYDGAMKLSVPMVLSGLSEEPDETERLRAENKALKKKLTALQEKKTAGMTVKTTQTVKPVKTVRQVYTDGIGE